MQAVVKTPHIDIKIKGDIPEKLLSVLKEEYGKKMRLIKEDNDEFVNALETDWYKNIKSKITPGENMKFYREIHKMTQAELGMMLGGIPRQHISNMENNVRKVSLKTAKKLAQIFDVSPEKFI